MKLKEIAYGRSGDKGAHSNIGIIAREEKNYEKLCEFLTEEKVASYFATLHPTAVKRYELPNLHALNFILYDALGEGASLSLRVDAQGKALAQALLEMELS